MSIVVTGTPGVGKHTAAAGLAARTGLGIVDINRVASECGLVEPGGGVDTEGLRDALVPRLEPRCILVGHLAPYVLDSGIVRTAIVLRRDPYELLATYAERGYPERKRMENAASEALGVTYSDSAGAFGDVFQVRAAGIEETAKKIADIVSGNGSSDDVDWLEQIEKRGDLRRFFAY